MGNHEFDQGFNDLVDRVIGPDAAPNAAFDHLGANVYLKGTTTPALDEYALEEVDGLTVGIIGAITQETPSLVTPAGIADLDFGDPVDAVNRVAAELTDGDEANGEADVIIASYHEGAGAGTPDGATLEEEVAAGGAFADIVTDTSAAVDVIFTGHTHKQYAWDAPIPGTDGETRPVLQTGSYGENIGNVVLELDPSSGDVIGYTAKNVARTTTADAELVAAYPRVAEVKTITDTALAAAAIIGDQPVGSVSADITTAFSGGSYVDGKYTGGIRDDRASESALGNLVANSLVSSLDAPERGGAEIGVVNPGGLRADLTYAPDGTITFAEANAVLPFVNNLWTTSLTGAQFKSVLEQQWQTNPDGTIPSRPFLKLGLSDNVEYTYDASRALGDRITGIWVDGEPIDAAASYRIGTFSFLTSGGDNFREFTNGTDARDSGLIDRDAWISYLQANPGLTPSFVRHAAEVKNVPTAPVSTGSTLTFDVSGLDLTSLGSLQNTTLAASWTGSAATFEPIVVANGAASVSLPVPLDAPAASELVLTAAPSGTVVHVPVTVSTGTTPEPEKPTTPPVDVPEDQLTQDLFGAISVAPDVVAPGGSVTVFVGTEHAGEWVSVWLYSTPQLLGDGWQQVSTNGGVTVTIPADAPAGTHKIAVLDAAGDLLGWASVTVTGVPDGSAGPDSGDLASTGATVFPWLALALLLLAAGAGAVVVRRRRSQA